MMKRILCISVCILIVAHLSAQNRKRLPEYYSAPDIGVRDEPQYITVPVSVGSEDRKTAGLPRGNYLIDDKYVYFEFTINANGMLQGDAKYARKKNMKYMSDLLYDNGMLVGSRTINKDDGSTYSESEQKDSVLTEKLFYPSGKLREVHVTDFRITKTSANTIMTTYYENGQVKSESNKIEQTFRVFAEDGTPERFMDDKNGIATFYNSDGSIDTHSYRDGDQYCKEQYLHGNIAEKECTSETEFRTYHYTTGVLSYVEVYNRQTGKLTFFDAQGKQIERRAQPRPMISL